ncbi:MAG: ABC transporter permease [Cyclobacteriaceae bacterium]|nr:ABC transporter permease [Cyclobacteriaceae bacterium]
MLSGYLKIILRQLRSIYSFINLTGLIVGFAAFILIYLWVEQQLSYDRFHSGYDNIYRVVENQIDESGAVYPVAVTPSPLSPYLKSTFAEIRETCRLSFLDLLVRNAELAFYQKGALADPSMFDLFSFPILAGETRSFETGVDKIIITKKLGRTYFGDTDPIGKTLRLLDQEMLITAVLEDIPVNSHIQFDFVMPFEFLRAKGYDSLINWGFNNHYTYIKLGDQIDPLQYADKIKTSISKHLPKSKTELALQPLSEIHLKSNHLNNDVAGRGNMLYVYIFSAVGIFILIIASINYANLSTARSIKRSKEAGVRKVVGASRSQLMVYFFSESLLYCFIGFVLALLLCWLLLPGFSELSRTQIKFNIFSPTILFPLMGAVIFCSFLGGVYPAILLSSLNPTVVLKGILKTGNGTIAVRRILVIIQFALAIAFLSGTFVVHNQLSYIRNRNLGFEKENLLTFPTFRTIRKQFQAFKTELLAIPGVQYVSATSTKISLTEDTSDDISWEGKESEKDLLFHQLIVDYDFLKTFSISLTAGRDFSSEVKSDSTAVLLNEEAINQMGLTDPLNKQFTIGKTRKGTIIGIVQNFNFKSAHKKIEPMVIYLDQESLYEAAVRFGKGNVVEQTKAVEAVYKKYTEGRPFEFSFVDEDIDNLYRAEQQTGIFFNWLAGLSIFISCLGLLGIVMFVTQQRGKEVAVRKVLGASVLQIMWMLSIEFMIPVIIAFCIATPVIYYLTDLWLQDFAYRLDPGVFVFGLAGLISLTIAGLTIGFKSYQVSRTNPANWLRSE